MNDQAAQSWSEQPQPMQSNTLGIVGFILAFCVSPLGLILSLVALSKPPRGFAVAGTVIGLIGTVLWAFFLVAMFVGGGAMFKGFGLGFDHAAVVAQLKSYASSHNGEFPADLVTAGVPEGARKDPWDREYQYVRSEDGKSWTMTSASFDGQFGTGDDVVFTSGMSQSDVSDAIGKAMQGHFNKSGGAPAAPVPASEAPAEPAESTPAPSEEKKPE
jgi:hypothetical protein